MFDTFPTDAREALSWQWTDFQPFADDLLNRDLTPDTLPAWLADVTRFLSIYEEVYARLYVAVDLDTTDETREAQYNQFLETVVPPVRKVSHQLNQKLVDSGYQSDDFDVPLRNIRADIALFREDNIDLFTQIEQLNKKYDKLIGAQTVMWTTADGTEEERTLPQMRPVFFDLDRDQREKAFRLTMDRQLQDRDTLNDLWQQLFKLRQQVAANAGFDNFRDYQWQAMNRFDYTPDDALRFHEAIEQVVVPAVSRLNDRRRQLLGLDTLRPWDLDVDPTGSDPLKPFKTGAELEAGTATIFNKVHPELGAYFQMMCDDQLLDLENRKGKAPGGYCISYDNLRRPFIFMNAVGLHDDLQTMLHEAGHAFHVFESAHWPYMQQTHVPMEFAEVASMAMELLASPYLTRDEGGFYATSEAARARIEHLEFSIRFWPYMAVVDAFQHWTYTSGDDALDPAACDAKWTELWHRFMPGADYTGLVDWVATGWQRKLHIFQIPFYYIEYGLAQLGAVQVWNNSLKDHAQALGQYRQALALGGTATLPDLFTAAGAKLAFDAATLQEAVSLMERTIDTLGQSLATA